MSRRIVYRGRWKMIDAEVDRLGVGNQRPYEAICAVCDANGIVRPLEHESVTESAQKIEDHLQRMEIRRLSTLRRASKLDPQ